MLQHINGTHNNTTCYGRFTSYQTRFPIPIYTVLGKYLPSNPINYVLDSYSVHGTYIHSMQALWHYGFGLGLFSPIASPSSMTQDYRVHKQCPW